MRILRPVEPDLRQLVDFQYLDVSYNHEGDNDTVRRERRLWRYESRKVSDRSWPAAAGRSGVRWLHRGRQENGTRIEYYMDGHD